MNTPETNEADVLEQQRDLDDGDELDMPPAVDVEADPADLNDQSLPVPSHEEDWREG